MPTPITVTVLPADLRHGDDVVTIDNEPVHAIVVSVDRPHLKAERDSHRIVNRAGGGKLKVHVDQKVVVIRQVPTYGDVLAKDTAWAVQAILWKIGQADAYRPAADVATLTVYVPDPDKQLTAGALLYNLGRVEDIAYRAKTADLWQSIAASRDTILSDPKQTGDGVKALIDAARHVAARAREVMDRVAVSGPRDETPGTIKALGEFLTILTGFNYQSDGLLTAIDRAQVDVYRYGADHPSE